LIWCFVAVVRGKVTHGIASVSLPQLAIGIVLTVSLMVIFSFGALSAGSVALRGY